MATATPVFVDNVAVVATATLARGAVTQGTIDLLAKMGAWLMVRIGRQGTTALTNGVDVLIRRQLNGSVIGHPSGIPLLSSTTAANLNTTVDADSAAGQKVLNVTSTTTVVAGDLLLIAGGTAREEWARVSSVQAAASVTLDRNLRFEHTAAQADTVRNKADIFAPIWLHGGAIWEVVFDYGDDAAGESVTVEAVAQRYDSDSIV